MARRLEPGSNKGQEARKRAKREKRMRDVLEGDLEGGETSVGKSTFDVLASKLVGQGKENARDLNIFYRRSSTCASSKRSLVRFGNKTTKFGESRNL